VNLQVDLKNQQEFPPFDLADRIMASEQAILEASDWRIGMQHVSACMIEYENLFSTREVGDEEEGDIDVLICSIVFWGEI